MHPSLASCEVFCQKKFAPYLSYIELCYYILLDSTTSINCSLKNELSRVTEANQVPTNGHMYIFPIGENKTAIEFCLFEYNS